MLNTFNAPVALGLPADARVNGFYATVDLADAYAISLPSDAVTNPE